MNNVCIIGRITKDIELKTTKSGLSAVSMFIAIDNGKDKNGEKRPADFPKIYVYEKQAENVSKFCHKGSLVAVIGKIKTRSWSKKDGTKGYETYILASRVQFLDSKQNDGAGIPEPDYVPIETPAEQLEDPFKDFGEEVTINPEDLPFESY